MPLYVRITDSLQDIRASLLPGTDTRPLFEAAKSTERHFLALEVHTKINSIKKHPSLAQMLFNPFTWESEHFEGKNTFHDKLCSTTCEAK